MEDKDIHGDFDLWNDNNVPFVCFYDRCRHYMIHHGNSYFKENEIVSLEMNFNSNIFRVFSEDNPNIFYSSDEYNLKEKNLRFFVNFYGEADVLVEIFDCY